MPVLPRWIALAWIALAPIATSSGAASLTGSGHACAWDQCDTFVLPDAIAAYSFGNPTGSYLSASVEAEVSYGSLRASADLYVGDDPWPFTQQGVGPLGSDATLRFDDEITVSGGSGPGTARITFRVHRAVQSGCDTVQPCISDLPFMHAFSTVSGSGGSSAGGPVVDLALYTDPQSPEADDVTELTTDPIPFAFGQPFAIGAGLYVTLHPDVPPDSITPVNAQGVLSAEVSVVRIALADDQGRPVPGATISASSGTVYPVPEPCAARAAVIAALMLAVLRIRGAGQAVSAGPQSSSIRE